MSAALQFPALARAAAAQRQLSISRNPGAHLIPANAPALTTPQFRSGSALRPEIADPVPEPDSPVRLPIPPNLAFYRKHTQSLLRRYLYASMLVARSPSMLTDPLTRGWASHRKTETFEDCIIFVLDIEKAFARLPPFDRLLLTRVVLQEHSMSETALLLDKAERVLYRRFADAMDRLTLILLTRRLLTVPYQPEPSPDDGRRR